MPIKTLIIKAIVFAMIALGIIGCSSKDSITEFAENTKMDRQFYVYPSTIQMINLEENETFNELVKDFKLGQFFVLKNTEENKTKVNELRSEMTKDGYIDIASFSSKTSNVMVYLLEEKSPKTAIIIQSDSSINIIQVEGMLNYLKLPELMHGQNHEDALKIMEFFEDQIKNQNIESHSQHQ